MLPRLVLLIGLFCPSYLPKQNQAERRMTQKSLPKVFDDNGHLDIDWFQPRFSKTKRPIRSWQAKADKPKMLYYPAKRAEEYEKEDRKKRSPSPEKVRRRERSRSREKRRRERSRSAERRRRSRSRSRDKRRNRRSRSPDGDR